MREAPPLTYLVSWGMVVCGVTLVVTQSTIFAPLRSLAGRLWPWLGKLLACPMCFGWWVGAALSLYPGLGPSAALGLPRALAAPLDGFAASAVAWTFHVALEAMGSGKL